VDDHTGALLRARDGDLLTAAYASMLATGSGRTVFVAGDSSAGRRALLRGWAAGLEHARPRPTVIGGAFEAGVYVPWERDRGAAAKAISTLEGLVSIGKSVSSLSELILPPPLVRVLGHVLSKSDAALELSHHALAEPDRADASLLVLVALRRLCDDGPVVCLIEAADATADGLWADLASLLARRVARDMPLLLILSIDGPELLGPHDDDESDALNVARQLTSDDVDVATWQWLAPLTPREIESWVGPAAPEVLSWLVDATDGEAGAIAELWHAWRAQGVVEDVTGGRWRFVTTAHARLFDTSEHGFEARLRALTGGDLNAIARATKTLGCAALEGRRFTAAAVAAALAHDVDDTIDYLDETLAIDGERADGFVVDDGFETIEDEHGTRHLAMYRFARDVDWRISRRHGLSDAEERHLGPRLARAMASAYGGQASRVAYSLARLCSAAGDADNARHFGRMANIGTNRQVLVWRARRALSAGDPIDPAERRRVSQLLIAASDTVYDGGELREALALAEAGHRLAELRSDAARALYLAAVAMVELREHDPARQALNRAEQLYLELGDRHARAATREKRAEIDLAEGHLDHAGTELHAVLAIHRALGDRRGEAIAQHQLARLKVAQDALDVARAGLSAALALYREAGDPYGEALSRLEIAEIDWRLGHPDRARSDLRSVLALFRQLGSRMWEGHARFTLALIDASQGREERARRELTALVALFREVGDPASEAACRSALDGLADA
jgi:tetratricopeptide (TPR) repeat protein